MGKRSLTEFERWHSHWNRRRRTKNVLDAFVVMFMCTGIVVSGLMVIKVKRENPEGGIMDRDSITILGKLSTFRPMEGKRTQVIVKVENTVENNTLLSELMDGDGGVHISGAADLPSSKVDPNQGQLPLDEDGEGAESEED